MIYSEKVKKACNICFEAHKEDKDKGGYPYVFHPFYLATQVDNEEATLVALLHDVIEDHGDTYTFEMLEKEFSKEVVDALRLMTHEKGVPYMEYVKEIAKNPIARQVKMEDLKHNLDARRVDGKTTKKTELYVEALHYLENH